MNFIWFVRSLLETFFKFQVDQQIGTSIEKCAAKFWSTSDVFHLKVHSPYQLTIFLERTIKSTKLAEVSWQFYGYHKWRAFLLDTWRIIPLLPVSFFFSRWFPDPDLYYVVVGTVLSEFSEFVFSGQSAFSDLKWWHRPQYIMNSIPLDLGTSRFRQSFTIMAVVSTLEVDKYTLATKHY